MATADFDPHVLGSVGGWVDPHVLGDGGGGGSGQENWYMSNLEVQAAAATTATTTWGDTTAGEMHQHSLHDQQLYQPYYTYTGGLAEELQRKVLKDCLREVLAELAAQDESFTSWLRMKYATIPVITRPEGGESDDRMDKGTFTVDPSAWRFGVGGTAATAALDEYRHAELQPDAG